MPAPDPANRERLLRLIDGGGEPAAKPAEKQALRVPAQGLIALAAVIAVFYYGVVASSSVIPASPVDEPGVGLRLVGVDSSDASPIALLEDLRTGKTYFVRVNEKVKDVRVKQIQKNKVTVSFRGKNVELH